MIGWLIRCGGECEWDNWARDGLKAVPYDDEDFRPCRWPSADRPRRLPGAVQCPAMRRLVIAGALGLLGLVAGVSGAVVADLQSLGRYLDNRVGCKWSPVRCR